VIALLLSLLTKYPSCTYYVHPLSLVILWTLCYLFLGVLDYSSWERYIIYRSSRETKLQRGSLSTPTPATVLFLLSPVDPFPRPRHRRLLHP
jgi:hypothetical protein